MSHITDKIIQLHPDDNVVVCIKNMQEGEELRLPGATVTIDGPIGLGHKLATKNIVEGETIVKYGVPIGSATKAIRPGELVHTHNMKSNYIATWLQG